MTLVDFVHEGASIDYTPGSAVAAGDVVVQNNLVGIAKLDIVANKKGALCIEGVFDFPKATGGGTAIGAGKKVYWDAGDEEAKEDSEDGANPFLGLTVASAADADTTVRVVLADAGVAGLANSVQGIADGYKVARGQHTTVAASDTVVTGLATVVAVVASLDSDPGDDPLLVSASIGDQAGAPAAGSVLIKTWKTNGTDPTPSAASTFSKKVNWIALGT